MTGNPRRRWIVRGRKRRARRTAGGFFIVGTRRVAGFAATWPFSIGES